MSEKTTVKMYPGMTFNFYIPDDLTDALTEKEDGTAELDKSALPCFKIEVLGHEAWVRMQEIGEQIDECRTKVLAGDSSQSVPASQLQRELVAAHVKGCDNFPNVEDFKIAEILEKDKLSPRHIAHLASAILAQRSNEDIEVDIKKKLDSPSDSVTEGADPENAPDTETARTDQPS